MEGIDFKNMDNKTKAQVAVTSVLVLVFVFVLGNSIKTIISKGKKTNTPSSYVSPDAFKEIVKRDMQDAKQITVANGSELYKAVKEESEKQDWGRDPFSKRAALSGGPVSISGLKLEGILYHYGKNPSALINGEVVSEGDMIGGIKIVEIRKDAVIVNDGKEDYKLSLW